VAGITYEGVRKEFPDGTVALHALDLEVRDGEFMILVGPSGCGKTTALRMVAGLEKPTAGRVIIGEEVVTNVPPRERDVAMVFQSYALYTHMKVRDNIGFPLRLRKRPKPEIGEAVGRVGQMLNLDPVLDRLPRTLSGGQRQRVAMGRALVRTPKAFLMDEPLSNLDAKLRVEMRGELSVLHRDLGTTFLYVTHDQHEALTMGERVAVLHNGRLQQVDSPRAIYDRPANLFVAAFIGSPSMNLFRATLERREGPVLRVSGHDVPLGESAHAWPRLGRHMGGEVVLGVRPEDLSLDRGGSFRARVEMVEWSGSDILARARIDAPPFPLDRWLTLQHRDGEEDASDQRVREEVIGGLFTQGEKALVSALLEGRSELQPGEEVSLRIDPGRIHLFDAESGEALERAPGAPSARRDVMTTVE
jgi:multiple sugar transport system ATP-binding protein